MQEHLNLLGATITDKITQTKGCVTRVAFDISGSVRMLVETQTGQGWLDACRVEPTGDRITACPFGDESIIS